MTGQRQVSTGGSRPRFTGHFQFDNGVRDHQPSSNNRHLKPAKIAP